MTFSIVACSEDRSCFGVAVASKFLAVGSAVPAVEIGAGALATQAYANLAYRPDGLALLRTGASASEVVAELTGADERRAERQLGMLDATGRAATYTGSSCIPWAGGRSGDGYAIQGNVLASERVVVAMEDAWRSSDPADALERRLLAVLVAGDDAGGDRRGRQSAAILVGAAGRGYGGAGDLAVDLRVDDHEHPLVELERLLELHDLYFGSPDPADLVRLDGAVLEEVANLLHARGYGAGFAELAPTRAALWEWAGIENLEDRILEDAMIDPVVLTYLREH
jgi:uncharacterized Ntn-hydrolase superfamily protein